MNWPPWAQTTREQTETATTLCPAVCTTHRHHCNLQLTPTDEHTTGWHVCQHGNTHEFWEATHDTPTPILG